MDDNSKEKERKKLYNKRYRERNKNFDKQLLDVLEKFGSSLGKIGIELVRASNSNPLIGLMTVFITTDILYRLKVIDLATAAAIFTAAGALEGSEIANTVLTDISDFFHVFGAQNKTPDPITPSAKTIVYGSSDNSTQDMVSALMERFQVTK